MEYIFWLVIGIGIGVVVTIPKKQKYFPPRKIKGSGPKPGY